jgi:hypothetical protein
MIQRFLPEKFKIGSGFIVRQTHERGNHEPSKQIDLIIYDTSYPMLFKDNDFVILTADSVLGIIEVKANATNQGLSEIVKKANNNGKFIYNARVDKIKPLFNGIFSYDTIANQIKNPWNKLGDNKQLYGVNHISFNQDWFYKFWKQEFNNGNAPHYFYEIKELSFSFFISNLIDCICGTSVIENSNLWFPVDKSFQFRKKY